MKKQVIFPAIAIGTLALAGALWFGSSKVEAASTTTDTLVEKIAQKFNLPQDQVQATFDEVHSEKQATRVAEQSTKLDQAVKDGVITQDQKDRIVAKMSEKRTERRAMRSEMQQWFKDNGIDETKLQSYLGGGREGMGHRGGMMGERPTADQES